jgi:hypothetical protein
VLELLATGELDGRLGNNEIEIFGSGVSAGNGR